MGCCLIALPSDSIGRKITTTDSANLCSCFYLLLCEIWGWVPHCSAETILYSKVHWLCFFFLSAPRSYDILEHWCVNGELPRNWVTRVWKSRHIKLSPSGRDTPYVRFDFPFVAIDSLFQFNKITPAAENAFWVGIPILLFEEKWAKKCRTGETNT